MNKSPILMHLDIRGWLTAISLTCVLLMPGCSGCNQNNSPRTRDDIFNDQMAVETLYFTEDGDQVLAPGSTRGMVVDEASGKLAHAAWQCNNPNCPGRGPEGEPYQFALPDPFAYIDEDGQPAIRQPETQSDF